MCMALMHACAQWWPPLCSHAAMHACIAFPPSPCMHLPRPCVPHPHPPPTPPCTAYTPPWTIWLGRASGLASRRPYVIPHARMCVRMDVLAPPPPELKQQPPQPRQVAGDVYVVEPKRLAEGEEKHIISAFVADEAGLINRVASVFARRGTQGGYPRRTQPCAAAAVVALTVAIVCVHCAPAGAGLAAAATCRLGLGLGPACIHSFTRSALRPRHAKPAGEPGPPPRSKAARAS